MPKTNKISVSRAQKHVNKRGIAAVAREISHSEHYGVTIHEFYIDDGYHQPWYKLERFGSRLLAAQMEAYLADRQHVDFAHPRNMARKVLYKLPSFSEWATLMPGALALEPIHHPEHRVLPTGKWIDPITRRLFRHGLDPVGVRTRTLMGGWLAHQYAQGNKDRSFRWLSLAGGTSAPSMLMINAAQIDKSKLHYANVDMNAHAIEIARKITDFESFKPEQVTLLVGDIFDTKLLDWATDHKPVDIVEMMGIFEYFDSENAAKLLRLAYKNLKPGGIIIAGNMRIDHPQLNLHKRGVGWPDVIPRDLHQLVDICRRASIPKNLLEIYQPKDGVYHVLRIRKA